jgi:hypothetical protein
MIVSVGAVTSLLAIAACGPPTGTDATQESTIAKVPTGVQSSNASPAEAATPTGEKSPRGNYLTQVGELAAVGDGRTGEPTIQWKLADLQVDAPCEMSFSKPPINGHLLIATVEAQTFAGFDSNSSLPGGFHPGTNWSLVNADGYTQPLATSDASAYCIPAEWPRDMTPASKYRFRLAFDSKSPTGVLQFRPSTGGGGGWEWSF